MRVTTATLAGIVLTMAAVGPAFAEVPGRVPLAAGVHGVAPLLQSSADEAAVRRAFRSQLSREPTARELYRYGVLMDEYGWTERDVRQDLRDRPDYRRYTTRTGGNRPQAAIRRAYQDILGREPDPEGLASYRSRMLNEGWSEQDVREALRRSPEYTSGAGRTASADRIIRRAYQEILNREPDPGGLENYRRNIIERGWDEHDVRVALRRSPENRAQRAGNIVRSAAVSDAQATEMVRRAYLSVLNREPDAIGMRDYKVRVLRDGWSERDLVNALRNSDEYRTKNQ